MRYLFVFCAFLTACVQAYEDDWVAKQDDDSQVDEDAEEWRGRGHGGDDDRASDAGLEPDAAPAHPDGALAGDADCGCGEGFACVDGECFALCESNYDCWMPDSCVGTPEDPDVWVCTSYWSTWSNGW